MVNARVVQRFPNAPEALSLTRRKLLTLAALGTAVSACGTGGSSDETSAESLAPSGGPDQPIRFSNWPQYIDTDEPTTLQIFTEQTGLEVVYTDDINDSAEFFAKVRTNLEQGMSIDRDIVVLTEEGADLFIHLGFAAPLDMAQIPNAVNLLPELRNPPFDPDRKYTLPWTTGFTGLGWNAPLLEREMGISALASLEQFFDPRLKGRVTVLSEMTDTTGLILNYLGYDMNSFTQEQFDEALAFLQERIDSGFIRQVTGNDYLAALESGDAIASFGWSGDVLALGDEFGFAIPESGGMVWADAMVIPSVSDNKLAAERLMNYYYDPVVAAQLAAWIQYACPVAGAQEAMEEIDPELVDDPWIFPTPELLSTVSEYQNMDLATREEYERSFFAVIGN